MVENVNVVIIVFIKLNNLLFFSWVVEEGIDLMIIKFNFCKVLYSEVWYKFFVLMKNLWNVGDII